MYDWLVNRFEKGKSNQLRLTIGSLLKAAHNIVECWFCKKLCRGCWRAAVPTAKLHLIFVEPNDMSATEAKPVMLKSHKKKTGFDRMPYKIAPRTNTRLTRFYTCTVQSKV